jgi:hypothetical protein
VKIALGHRLMDGPWGGGNMFAHALYRGLEAAGHRVCFGLADDDIDAIVLTDPRRRNPAATFGPGAVLRYLWLRNPQAVVVHRVNECDLRKGTAYVDAMLARANYCADATVFVGAWLAELPIWRANQRTPLHVVRNGADAALFNAVGQLPWDGAAKLRLVTHHWGFHPLKGFDVYAAIDALLDDPAWRARLEFTYVGNLPPGFRFRNAVYKTPLAGPPLADELRRHHVYVTASQYEPGGNHQNEGACCGLPLLYRNSGCMPEYCAGFGEMFDGPDDFEAALVRMIANYQTHRVAIARYPWTAQRMCAEWIELVGALVADRQRIAAARRLWRSPAAFLRSQIAA